MQKIIFSIFAPFLVAIVLRVVLFLVGLIALLFSKNLAGDIAGFHTFEWDESYLYWILVVIVTFFVEMAVWSEEDK